MSASRANVMKFGSVRIASEGLSDVPTGAVTSGCSLTAAMLVRLTGSMEESGVGASPSNRSRALSGRAAGLCASTRRRRRFQTMQLLRCEPTTWADTGLTFQGEQWYLGPTERRE